MNYHAVIVICTYIELSIIKYHSIQHFIRNKMTATHFLVCSEPENVYHIGWLFIYLCVPHPISINWSLYFSHKIKYL